MWQTLVFAGTSGLFLAMAIAMAMNLRWVTRLPALDTLPPAGEGTVRCSVVISARDEAARIEQTVRCLFAQQGVEAEFIIVDDRSTDGTAQILARLTKEDARLHVKTVSALPDRWLGKCHGCHVGASAAKGDWILFTDADCWLKPDVILRAVRLAEREGADHVTIAPGTVMESRWARAWHLMFLTALLGWFAGVNRDRRKSYVGIGAFNLVRASAYRACGGYEALRLTVVDDVKLGLLLRRAGKRTRAFLGADDVECHWGHTVGQMVKIMEKNYFAAVDFRLGLVVAGTLSVTAILLILLLGLFSGTVPGWVAVLSPLALIIPAGNLARRMRLPWSSAILVPLMPPVFYYAIVNSTFVTLRQGGVRWRDTLYGLKMLREGNVQ